MKSAYQSILVTILAAATLTARAQVAGPGSALQFNGTNGYAALSNTNVLNFNGSFTVEAWVKTSTTNLSHNWEAIVTKGDTAWRLHRYNGTHVASFGTAGLSNGDLFGVTPIDDRQWHHVAGVYDGSNKYLFVDGALEASNSVTGTLGQDSYPVYIGENAQATNRVWEGAIDEVRIWNVARSQMQVQTNMHRNLTGNETGLVAYYRLDEGAGTTFTNSASGANANGSLVGNVVRVASDAPIGAPLLTTLAASDVSTNAATLVGTVSPFFQSAGASFSYGPTTAYGTSTPTNNVHGALQLDGTSACLTNPTPVLPANNSAYTIEAWINPTTMGNQGIVAWGNIGNNNQVNSLRLDPGGVRNDWWGNDLIFSTNLSGAWHYVAASFDGTTRRLYVDGSMVTSDSPGNSHAVPSASLQMGTIASQSFFNGSLDEVRIWNTNLPQATLTNWMFRGVTAAHPNYANLAAYWSFNDGSGTTVADLSGHGNSVGFIGSPAWIAGRTFTNEVIGMRVSGLTSLATYHFTLTASNAGGFATGSDASFTVPTAPTASGIVATDITTNSATLVAIINPDAAPTTAYFQYGLTTQYGSFSTTNYLAGGSTPVGVANVITGLDPGTIYHFQLVVSNAVGGLTSADYQFTSDALAPGVTTGSATAINEGAATLVGTVNPFGAPVTAWFEYGLTPALGSTSAIAQIGNNALFYNGTNTYVSIADDPAFQFTGPFTIEAWFKVAAFVNNYQAIVTKGDSSWRLQENGSLNTLDFGSTGLKPLDLGGNTNVNNSQWHHAAAVFNGTSKSIYVDGNLNASANAFGAQAANSFPVFIGANAEAGNRFWDGAIDEVRLWRTNLSQTTLQNFMFQTVPTNHPNYNQLAGYWTFNAIIGTNVPDASGNGHDGTLFNNPLAVRGAPLTNEVITTQAALLGLLPGTNYYFRLVSSNLVGLVSTGAVQQLTTLPATPPVLTLLPASNVGLTGAVFNASAQMFGLQTALYFEYGTTTNYGSVTASTNILSLATIPVTQTSGNLVPATTYHFRIVATNVAGVFASGDLTFNTSSFAALNPGFSTPLITGMALGDFNNDGYLDVLDTGGYSGSTYCQIWQNLGNGSFTNINLPVPGVSSGAVACGDFDNDGKLDIVISGYNGYDPVTGASILISQIWRNAGNGVFQLYASLPGMQASAIALADFDNDGRLDILIAGYNTNNAPDTQLWRNMGNGTFTRVNVPLPGLIGASLAWGDFDRDGRPDILLTGALQYSTPGISQVWHNNGDGTFSNLNLALPGISYGSASWGDFDNDGYPDILLCGTGDDGNPYTAIWRNLGNGTFTNVNAGLPAVAGSAAWGDFDNDGYLDILIAGVSQSDYLYAGIWRNLGNGTFSTNINSGLPANYQPSVAWGDFNNDGRLDVALSGSFQGNTSLTIFQNLSSVTNTPPSEPTGLQATVIGSEISLQWNPAMDLQTPASGLSYNLRIGTTSGGGDVVSPESDLASGFRLIPAPGNLGSLLSDTNYTANLPGGFYYWSVQAVDSAFAGSAFASESTFVVLGGAPSIINPVASPAFFTATLSAQINPIGDDTFVRFQWGTTTNYGSSTALQGIGNGVTHVAVNTAITNLTPNTTYHWRVVAFNPSGTTRTGDQTFTIPQLSSPRLASLVRRLDGSLSLGLSGTPNARYTVQTSIDLTQWTDAASVTADNNGIGQFIVTNASLPKQFFRLKYP